MTEPAIPVDPVTAPADPPPVDAVTAPVDPPKWSGAAAVPPAAPRRKRWLEDESVFPAPPPPPAGRPDPTLDMPVEPDTDTPVDPWADADPLPSYVVDVAYPPTMLEPAVAAPPPPPPPAAAPPAMPVPVRRPPAPPVPEPVRPRKAKRSRRPEPQGPPPGWRPPPGYVAVPVRRRRRWPWFALLSLLCCCGCPAWFGFPAYSQYPATAVVPSAVGGLTLRDDPQTRQKVETLKAEMRAKYLLVTPFAGVFVDGDGKRATIVGTTSFHWSTDGDVTAEINRVTETYHLKDVQTVAATERGEHRRCGVGRDGKTGVVVCSWVDHGSLGTGVFTRLDVEDSNARLSQLRDTIVTREADG